MVSLHYVVRATLLAFRWAYRFIRWAYFPPKKKPPVYEIISRKESVAGAYTIHSIVDGVMKKRSQFPKTWSQKEVEKNIREAFKDGMKRNPEQLPNGYDRITGYTKQNLPLEIIFDTDSKTVKKAHPYI